MLNAFKLRDSLENLSRGDTRLARDWHASDIRNAIRDVAIV